MLERVLLTLPLVTMSSRYSLGSARSVPTASRQRATCVICSGSTLTGVWWLVMANHGFPSMGSLSTILLGLPPSVSTLSCMLVVLQRSTLRLPWTKFVFLAVVFLLVSWFSTFGYACLRIYIWWCWMAYQVSFWRSWCINQCCKTAKGFDSGYFRSRSCWSCRKCWNDSLVLWPFNCNENVCWVCIWLPCTRLGCRRCKDCWSVKDHWCWPEP